MDTFNKRIIYSIELSMLILACLLFASYYDIKRANTRELWLKHSDEVLVHTGRIQLAATESGMSARDFMLTGDQASVTRFNQVSNQALKELDTVRHITADNLVIPPLLDSVGKYLNIQTAFSKRVISLRKSQGLAPALALVQAGKGKIDADRGAFFIRQVEHNENGLLSVRKAESKKALSIVNISLFTTGAFILAFIVMLLKRGRKEAKDRSRLLDRLIRNNEHNNIAEKLASLGTWSMNLDTQVVSGSDEMYRIWAIDPAKTESVFESFIQKVHPEDRNFVLQKTLDVGDKTNVESYNFRILNNGQIRYLNNGVTVIRNADHKLHTIAGYVQDITEKRLAAVDLEDAHIQLTTLFNRIGEVLFSRDVVENRFMRISDNCDQIFGYNPEEFKADPELWIAVIHSEDRHLIESGNVMLAQGVQTVNQYRVIRKDGAVRWVENKRVPWVDAKGTLVRVDAVIKDITEKRLAELEYDRMIADVVQRNKTLEQFTYIVSHNFRAPVANIIGLSQILDLLPNANPAEQMAVIKHILSSVNNLDHIVKDLTMVLQVREPVNEKKETVYFNDLLTDVKMSLQPVINQNNLQISCDFSQVDRLFTIRNYLYSIFYHLLLNSVNYRREDIVTMIRVEAYQTSDHLELAFTDNGKGIDLVQNGSKLFDLYSRFDTSIQGRGMGLFMVKTQVEALGGTIGVKSSLMKGTKFNIILPLMPTQ